VSDHDPILLQWAPEERKKKNRRKKLFRYEMVWETHDNFVNMLAQTWQDAGMACTLQNLHDKLANDAGSLSVWGANTLGHVRQELKAFNEELVRLRSEADRGGVGPSHAEIKVVEKIMELNHREEIIWKQHSRIMWLMEGDKNIRFFHLRASQRHKRNHISKLKRSDGTTTEIDEEMGSMATNFFQNIVHLGRHYRDGPCSG
jgi:hypothetical protein